MMPNNTRQAFSSEDFRGSGQYILRASANPRTNVAYSASVLWKVCYHNGEGEQTTHLTSMMDGHIGRPYGGKTELCRELNDDERGYRTPSAEELMLMLAFIGSRV